MLCAIRVDDELSVVVNRIEILCAYCSADFVSGAVGCTAVVDDKEFSLVRSGALGQAHSSCHSTMTGMLYTADTKLQTWNVLSSGSSRPEGGGVGATPSSGSATLLARRIPRAGPGAGETLRQHPEYRSSTMVTGFCAFISSICRSRHDEPLDALQHR